MSWVNFADRFFSQVLMAIPCMVPWFFQFSPVNLQLSDIKEQDGDTVYMIFWTPLQRGWRLRGMYSRLTIKIYRKCCKAPRFFLPVSAILFLCCWGATEKAAVTWLR